MIKVKEVNSECWLLQDGKESSILTKGVNRYVLYTNRIIKDFKDKKEIQDHFGFDVFSADEKFTHDTEYYINGYPVNSDTPFLVEDKSGMPVYSKTRRKKVQYCAGYYAIKSRKQWIIKYCLKKSKVGKGVVLGPFKSKEETKKNIKAEKARLECEKLTEALLTR